MATAATIPPQYRSAEIERRIALVASSFARLMGRPLVDAPVDAPVNMGADVVAALWDAPAVVVAHGTEPDPVFFFGNRRALEAFETDVESFTRMPSRFSAEAPLRDERQALLNRVSANGFIDDYAGIRISATGRRFRIERAVVWNLIDGEGGIHGQAARFVL